MGGCAEDPCGRDTPATAYTYRIDIGMQKRQWVREAMPAPRVLGFSTLLPDGTVFVANGARIGEYIGFALPQLSVVAPKPWHVTNLLQPKKLMKFWLRDREDA